MTARNLTERSTTDTATIMRLRSGVERAIGHSLTTPSDFGVLSAEIATRSGGRDAISISTIKRLWGYVASAHQPSEAILSVLARFCGYRDWAHFASQTEADSGFLVMQPLTPASLSAGDCLELTWAPDRVLNIRYIGGDNFEVIKSSNAKLKPGDTFSASIFCKGYPLYATSIKRGPSIIPAYVAARSGGLLSVAKVPPGIRLSLLFRAR